MTLDVPSGAGAGDCAYLIKPFAWPLGLTIEDVGATVNAVVGPSPVVDNSAPAIT